MNNKEAHKAENSAVIHNGSATDHFAVQLRRDKSVWIGCPKNIRVMQARIPAFMGCPIHSDIQLGARHVANVESVVVHKFTLTQEARVNS